jgi:hypothetical protein
MDPANPVVLIVAIIAGLTVLMLGLSWLFNGAWPWQRPPHGADEIDPRRTQDPGLLGRPFPAAAEETAAPAQADGSSTGRLGPA